MRATQVLAAIFACTCLYVAVDAQTAEKGDSTVTDQTPIGMMIGGVGGVYFLAEPGELVIELEKRDRHLQERRTDLRAILAGPDRQVLQEVTIPDDGKPKGSGIGEPQRVRLSTQVTRKGVYVLNVTVSQDRYGDEIAWGMRTNCPRYLVETSRGHRDSRRLEPVVLLNDGKSSDICFGPREAAFGIEVTSLPRNSKELAVYDANGELVQTLPVDKNGKASGTIPADVHRDAAPWRLHIPEQPAVVQIDGVTRWDKGDQFTNLPYWTPEIESWFPFREYRWLLTPYSRTAYGEPGTEGQVSFKVHNNSEHEETVSLRAEASGATWPARLSADEVVLGPGKSAQVTVSYEVPAQGQTRACHLTATPAGAPDFSTYSTVTVNAGVSPASRAIPTPLMLKAYQHENEQFGYLPDYPLETQMYFDPSNRPYVRTAGGVSTCENGQWTEHILAGNVRSDTPALNGASFGMSSTKVAFDRDGGLYFVSYASGNPGFLHSADGGKTFTAYAIPPHKSNRGSFDIEQFSGHNTPAGPPPFVRFARTGGSDPRLRWRSVNDLELFVPKKENGKIVVGEPILISDMCIGLSAHSGIPSSVVSRGSKIHVSWGEATDPEEKIPGVPQYVVTYDSETGKLGEPALIGYGPPANDVHNSPCITMDSKGYLHALVGTHGRPFQYTQSLKPNDAGSGWTEPVPLGENLGQTYIGLVCGADDTLYSFFRLWRNGGEPFPASSHATLAFQRKRPGQPWEEPTILIVAAFSEYSVYYHRLTIDQMGRLFLSYDYWSTFWFYRTDHFGDRRAVMMSPDGGETWKLVETSDVG